MAKTVGRVARKYSGRRIVLDITKDGLQSAPRVPTGEK
jgi:hypothetical protein